MGSVGISQSDHWVLVTFRSPLFRQLWGEWMLETTLLGHLWFCSIFQTCFSCFLLFQPWDPVRCICAYAHRHTPLHAPTQTLTKVSVYAWCHAWGSCCSLHFWVTSVSFRDQVSQPDQDARCPAEEPGEESSTGSWSVLSEYTWACRHKTRPTQRGQRTVKVNKGPELL